MSADERGFTDLLGQLQRRSPTVPAETLYAAISHYLSHIPQYFTSRQLTAAIISSPLWDPLSLSSLASATSVFRHAIRAKYDALQSRAESLFSSKRNDFNAWLAGIVKGLDNGDTLLRLAISGGLILELTEHLPEVYRQRISSVEEEVIASLAEILDSHTDFSSANTSWEKAFSTRYNNHDEQLRLALLLASQFLPVVSDKALSVLIPSSLVNPSISIIQEAFISGQFLDNTDSSDAFIRSIQSLATSEDFRYIGALSKMLAREIECAPNCSSRSSRAEIGGLLRNVIGVLQEMSANIEKGWIANNLLELDEDNLAEPSLKDTAKILWETLKTYLFVTVMLHKSILSILIYESIPERRQSSLARSDGISAMDVCVSLLVTLAHLSPLVSRFGGVTINGSGEDSSSGFRELKYVFYASLDILSRDSMRCDILVKRLLDDEIFIGVSGQSTELKHPLWGPKMVYVLACIEQLVPNLSSSVLEGCVLPICFPYLMDTEHRDVYEAAHSVVLSIFSAPPLTKIHPVEVIREIEQSSIFTDKEQFIRRLIPGYVDCLIKNSGEGQLSTVQFCLAYSSIVQSLTIARRRDHNTSADEVADEALVGFCIATLTEAINNVQQNLSADPMDDNPEEHSLKLKLAFISLVPNVAMPVLAQLLETVSKIINNEKSVKRKETLINSLHSKILHNVGIEEKDYAVRWWFANIEESLEKVLVSTQRD